MKKITDYKNLIKELPVKNQSTKIKREVWARISYENKQLIENEIFGTEEEVELSREDVISEADITKKIIMTLMWGYPTGGRGNNIENILKEINSLEKLMSSVSKKNLSAVDAEKLLISFSNIRGLGISTWSKLLFFFEVSFDSKKCQIYDLKIVDSLNKKQFVEVGSQKWVQDIEHYYEYIELIDNLSNAIKVFPEQIEVFLFYYNLYYKF